MSDDREVSEYASPPCYQHEFDSTDLTARLNELVESERAGARGLVRMTAERGHDELNELLEQVARDEARFCSMLRKHVQRLGGAPSDATGDFLDKFIARDSDDARLRLLDRGQSAVVRMLDELLQRPLDAPLRADLEHMRSVHRSNLERCARFIE